MGILESKKLNFSIPSVIKQLTEAAGCLHFHWIFSFLLFFIREKENKGDSGITVTKVGVQYLINFIRDEKAIIWKMICKK